VTYTFSIPNYLPARLNEIMWCHWRVVASRKKLDANTVAYYAIANRIPRAECRRRLDLHITLPPRGRKGDEGNWWKSIEDALVHAGMLIDDNDKWYEKGKVTFCRGPAKATLITLTNL
jgi:hypothetical protein